MQSDLAVLALAAVAGCKTVVVVAVAAESVVVLSQETAVVMVGMAVGSAGEQACRSVPAFAGRPASAAIVAVGHTGFAVLVLAFEGDLAEAAAASADYHNQREVAGLAERERVRIFADLSAVVRDLHRGIPLHQAGQPHQVEEGSYLGLAGARQRQEEGTDP